MPERERSSFLLPAAAAIAVPVLYVLSIGPVAAMIRSGWMWPGVMPVLEIVYKPLEVLDSHSELLHTLFEWYMDLWRA